MKTICFFDIESTGLETTTDRIIQISLVKTNLNLDVLDKKKLNLSNCGVPIHPDAFKAHKINELDLVGLYSFAQYSQKIYDFIQQCDFIAGFNIKGFDIQILYEEFARSGIVWNHNPAIDCGVIFKNREKRTLAAAFKFYTGNEIPDGSAHDAENDILSTIEVLRGQINKYGLDKVIKMVIQNNENKPDELIYEELDSILISESKYDNEDKRLSWDGKIILGEDGKAKWNFGKFKGEDLRVADLGYVNYILSSNIASQTKNILKSYLNG